MTDWQWRRFTDLSLYDLYAILRLRAEVFIVEQKCVWLDLDDQDQQAMHLLGKQDDTLVAYLRVLPANSTYPDWVSIGRVVTKNTVRAQGVGKQAFAKALQYLEEHNNPMPVVISAQLHLKEFYQAFGFHPEGAPYDEDGIMHTRMRLK